MKLKITLVKSPIASLPKHKANVKALGLKKVGQSVIHDATPQIKGQLDDVDKKGAAKLVGKLVGERALNAGIKIVVFDRGGYVYTGRVAELAAGAREAGLNF